MASKNQLTAALTKRTLIERANTTTVAVAAVAAFMVVFTLVSGRALLGQAIYQNRVISEKKKTLTQLKTDLAARDTLVSAYQQFSNTSQNVIGGSPTGAGDRDGDNGKIILDALPSKYDFPGWTSSLEKLASSQGLKIQSLTGTDDEVAQTSQQTSSTPQPQPVPFQIAVEGSYPQAQALIETFDKSIRPIQVQALSVTASSGDLTMTVTAQTYYQPEKILELKHKVVK